MAGCLFLLTGVVTLICFGLSGWNFIVFIPFLSFWAIAGFLAAIYINNSLFGYELDITDTQKHLIAFLLSIILAAIICACTLVVYVDVRDKNVEENNYTKTVYEEIKVAYENEKYDEAGEIFKKLDGHKGTEYAKKAKNEFGDYKEKEKAKKAEQVNAEKRAIKEKEVADWNEKGQEVMDAFVNLHSKNDLKYIFAGARSNMNTLTIEVNDNWNRCSEDVKQAAIKSFVVTWCGMQEARNMSTADIKRWHFKIIHNLSGRTLATYDNVWGPSIKD